MPAPQAIGSSPPPSIVSDLVAVLGQTRSKDVFAATVLALGQMGAAARPALPAILKNAERLGVLEGAFAPGGSKSDQGDVVLDAVQAIALGQVGPGPSVPVPAAYCATYLSRAVRGPERLENIRGYAGGWGRSPAQGVPPPPPPVP
jgi:hypothetical protein